MSRQRSDSDGTNVRDPVVSIAYNMATDIDQMSGKKFTLGTSNLID